MNKCDIYGGITRVILEPGKIKEFQTLNSYLKMSATEKILKHLKSGKSLTVLECLNRFQTHKLSARISEFRQQGYKIKIDFIFVGKGKDKKKIAKYSMK